MGIGYQALYKDTLGANNVGVGNKTLSQNLTGNSNIALGNSAGYAVTGSNNISIGNTGVAGENSVIRIGTFGTHSNTILSGNVSIGSGSTAGTPLQVTANGFGMAHSNGTTTLASYVDGGSAWLGTTTNHPLYFYTNNNGFPAVSLTTAGNLGINTITPTAKLHVNGDVAIEGAIRVPGAGVGTGKSVFIHQATAANTAGSVTTISNAYCDGDPSAVLFITPNFNGGAGGAHNNHVAGVFYTGGKWIIYNVDGASMPVNTFFNVMVVKP